MSDEYGLQGLSGVEIKEDATAQFRKQLDRAGSSTLRHNDSYRGGYSAKITYEIRCYGLDQEVISGEFSIGTEQEDPDAEVIVGELVIEQEEDLGEVRDRIQQAKLEEEGGSFEESGEEATEVPTGEGVRQKRKYTRKLKLASPGVIGGAEEFTE